MQVVRVYPLHLPAHVEERVCDLSAFGYRPGLVGPVHRGVIALEPVAYFSCVAGTAFLAVHIPAVLMRSQPRVFLVLLLSGAIFECFGDARHESIQDRLRFV
jgi:hypothetical protein